MKKVLCGILTLILLFSLSLSAFAVPQADPAQRFYDYAGLVSGSDAQRFREELQQLSQTTGMDVAVVLMDDNEGYSSAEYADDFYDYNGFGEDGLLMLVNMDDREVWISTCGRAIGYFTDAIIDDMTLELVEPLGDGDYSGAVSLFMAQVDEVLSQPSTGVSSSMNDAPRPVQPAPKTPLGEIAGLAAIAGAVVGGVVVLIMALLHKRLPNKTTNTFHYVTDGRVKLHHNRDIFINSTVTKTRIQRNNSTGGRGGMGGHSSVHRSSSGRSHGGGGRRF